MGGPLGIWSGLWHSAGARLVLSTAGWPLIVTRVAGSNVIGLMVAQGCGLPGGTVNGQPAITNWSEVVAAGIPLSSTRVLVEITWTGTPCGQFATAPTWKREPGIAP